VRVLIEAIRRRATRNNGYKPSPQHRCFTGLSNRAVQYEQSRLAVWLAFSTGKPNCEKRTRQELSPTFTRFEVEFG